tara:strand:- start:762 stop:1025 length:264 start_codon:yes stop_codon:yes gene_type:complete
MREPQLGEAIVYCDPTGVDYDALITAVWGTTCINLLFVSGDENRKDSYGRQVERQTSMSHVSQSQVHGFYWRFKEDKSNPYKAPLQT